MIHLPEHSKDKFVKEITYTLRQKFGLLFGPVLFFAILLNPAPSGMETGAWHTAAVALLMAVFWMTEAIPIPVTALLPLVLFPLLGVGDITEVAAPFANPLIYLFMGGFIIALAMQRWGLHKRIALNIIKVIGTRPKSIIAGFMISCAFLSMWVSNTATALMMLPIGLSVIELIKNEDLESRNNAPRNDFAIALMLGIAYSSSIGGLGTLIGTPPNALMAGFLKENYGFEIGFAQWMLVGLPIVLIGLPVCFFMLTRFIFPIRIESLPGSEELIKKELKNIGTISNPEKMVATVFALVAFLWITRPLLTKFIPGWSDAGIAILGAFLLFVLPANSTQAKFLLDWKYAERLPWGILILFGGGLSLAAAINRTGLSAWFGESMTGLSYLPVVLMIAILTCVIIFLTELNSNTATAAAFLPLSASIAPAVGQNPLLFVIPVALAASCAFMLPVATPPNAIVYSSDVLTIPQMARAGIFLNIFFIFLITLLSYSLILFVFDIQLGVVPDWVSIK